MKKNLLFFAIITLLTSCLTKNDPQPLADQVSGVWRVTHIDGDAVGNKDKLTFTFTKVSATNVNGLFQINSTKLDMKTITLTNSGKDILLESDEGLGSGKVSGSQMNFWLNLGGDLYELEATK